MNASATPAAAPPDGYTNGADHNPPNEPHANIRTLALSDLVSEFVRDTEAAAEALRTGRPRGAITGLSKIDRALGGYFAPGLHFLLGAPGCGKTAFALQTVACCRFPALYVSAEMSLLELFRRLIARETGTFLERLKTGELGAREAERLALATAERLPHLKLMDATLAYADAVTILDAAEGWRDCFQSTQVLIVIDSLQDWARGAKSGKPELALASEYDLINEGLNAAARIAHALASPVMMLSHRNRAGQRDGGGLHASKGSGDVEYKGETVIDLSPVQDKTDARDEKEVTATFHKNRNGAAGKQVKLRFHGALQEFHEA